MAVPTRLPTWLVVRHAGLASTTTLRSPLRCPPRCSRGNVAPGQRVERNDVVMVLEAMKMELPVRSPRDGVVKVVGCQVGELVQPGTTLLSSKSPRRTSGMRDRAVSERVPAEIAAILTEFVEKVGLLRRDMQRRRSSRSARPGCSASSKSSWRSPIGFQPTIRSWQRRSARRGSFRPAAWRSECCSSEGR